MKKVWQKWAPVRCGTRRGSRVGRCCQGLCVHDHDDLQHFGVLRRPLEPALHAHASALGDFGAAWGQHYPGIGQMWRDAWEQIIPFLAFCPQIRTVSYTTNAIESVNYQLRKITKNRGHFPKDEALLMLLYLAVRNREKKGRRYLGVSETHN